jgi:uncharacterized membrane protein
MTKTRLEAFSDGVIAILVTIMVLELHSPAGSDLTALYEVLPSIAIYVLSFIMLSIYWNNHHHLLHATTHINGTVLWANTHLLFWLSLIPFATRWIAETALAPLPTALYACVLFVSAVAYTILVRAILACQPPNSLLARAIGGDIKGRASLALYAIAIPLTFVNELITISVFVLVALIWFVPDRRIEGLLSATTTSGPRDDATRRV